MADSRALIRLKDSVRIDTSGEFFQTVIDRDCGHTYQGCTWNTEAAARRHGEILLKHTICGTCQASGAKNA